MVKQTEKERGDPGTQRKKRSPLCPQTTPLMGSILSLIFFIGKLDLLYAFNFFNLVLDLDSKIRAKEIRF